MAASTVSALHCEMIAQTCASGGSLRVRALARLPRNTPGAGFSAMSPSRAAERERGAEHGMDAPARLRR